MVSIPLKFTGTKTWIIWVEDDEDEGAERLARSISDSGVPHEYLDPGQPPVDAWLDVAPLTGMEWEMDLYHGDPVGPWEQCRDPECKILLYPPYGQRFCFKHAPPTM